MFLLVFLRYQYENERLPTTSPAFCQNIENELYSDAVKIFPSRKTNFGKPISAWLGLE